MEIDAKDKDQIVIRLERKDESMRKVIVESLWIFGAGFVIGWFIRSIL